MVQAKIFHPSIHLTLKKLIDEKSIRDSMKFTACQLANSLGMPRSMITKLTHPDKSKRVVNPRIDTLIKITEFFRADGFDISLEDLVGIRTSTIDISEQLIPADESTHTIPVYLLNNEAKKLAGSVDIKLPNWNPDIFGLKIDTDIAPFFKSGSIFFLNPSIPIEPDNLIAVVPPEANHVQLKKYSTKNNKIVLKSLLSNENDVILMPTSQYEILGVVVQVNAKT